MKMKIICARIIAVDAIILKRMRIILFADKHFGERCVIFRSVY